MIEVVDNWSFGGLKESGAFCGTDGTARGFLSGLLLRVLAILAVKVPVKVTCRRKQKEIKACRGR